MAVDPVRVLWERLAQRRDDARSQDAHEQFVAGLEVAIGIVEALLDDRQGGIDPLAEEAYGALDRLRVALGLDITDAQDDAIHHLQDLLVGYCVPSQRIGTGSWLPDT